ncbi:MAG: hypothetical protein ABIE70_11990 [bacterium]
MMVVNRGKAMFKPARFGILLLLLIATATLAADGNQTEPADSKSGEQINWQVISSGGIEGASTNYRVSGTAGQTAVGSGSSTNYGVGHGYWQPFGGSGGDCCDLRADINHDGVGPDIADLVYLVNYMFNGGPEPPCNTPYYLEADVNGDAVGPDIGDLVYLVNYMFNGGPAPVACP